VVTAVVGAASVAAALAMTAAPAQAAATPHANTSQAAAGHAVSPAARVWRSVALFRDEGDCLDAGLAYVESGEAFDYDCHEVLGCPTYWILSLLVNDTPAAAALPARFSAVAPAC
jgi:hypothetical protein